jgi:hypothetical protein
MARVRRRLAWIVCAWLLSQAAGVAAAPFALCCTSPPVAHDDEEKCCPGLLPGQMCPMHHTREGQRTCKMRSACANTDAALIALSGGLGDLPASTSFVSAFEPGAFVATLASSTMLRTSRPESPPPRA